MLKRYKNGFIDIVGEAGLSPMDFRSEDTEIDGLPVFVIRYGDSPLKFIVLEDEDNRHDFDWAYTVFSPDFPRVPSNFVFEQRLTIQDIYNIFKRWLADEVVDYVDDCRTPDLWAHIQEAKSLVNGNEISGDELTDFSEEEKIQLRLSINDFRQAIISNFSPPAREMHIINDRLDYLSKALDRLNRFDWRGTVVSGLISIAITLSLDTQKGHLLYELFRKAFATVLRYLQQ